MRNLILVCLVIICTACTSEECSPGIDACASNDAIIQVPWLATMKSSIEKNCSTCLVSLMQGTYRSKTVFFIHMNDPFCNNGGNMDLYNCAGKVHATIDISQFTEVVQVDRVLYSCEK